MDEIVIFLGPSLAHADAAAQLPSGRFLPPARQGDVYRAVRAYRPKKIGLVDGVFLNVPAVWHREILWALEHGVEVFGAASMGALRAAELDDYGMAGVGKIYTSFREGLYPPFDDPFEDDDEVAVAHAPVELGSRALSDAMVDIRETLACAEAAGTLDRNERDRLAGALKRVHFPERSFSRLAEAARGDLDPARAERFVTWLDTHRVSQKAVDAAELLVRIGRGDAARGHVPFQLERALVWERFVAEEQDADVTSDEEAVLAELGLDPGTWRDAAYAAMGKLAVGEESPGEQSTDTFARFRRRHGLASRASIDLWLNENCVAPSDLSRLLDGESAAEDGLARMPRRRLRRAVLDHLKLTGRFAALFERAGAKADSLGPGRAPPPGPVYDGALSWYFESRLGEPMPGSLGAHAAGAGFGSTDAFRDAIWREFLYVCGSRQS